MKKYSPAFSLIELLFVLSLSTLLCFGIVYEGREWLDQTQFRLNLHALRQRINLLALLAIANQEPLILCPIENIDKPLCENDWSKTQIIKGEKTNHIFQTFPGFFKNTQLKWQGNGQVPFFEIYPDGFAKRKNAHWILMMENTKLQADIIVNRKGRVHIEKGLNG